MATRLSRETPVVFGDLDNYVYPGRNEWHRSILAASAGAGENRGIKNGWPEGVDDGAKHCAGRSACHVDNDIGISNYFNDDEERR